MKIALIGLANSGKTTLFNAITGMTIETQTYPTVIEKPHIAVVKVPDERLYKIADIFKPKKTTPATIEYLDYIGLTKGDIEQNKKVFELIKNVDAVVYVIRLFEDDSIIHPFGEINPVSDLETIELELIFADLELVEKRLDRINLNIKQGKKINESEMNLMITLKEYLNNEISLKDISLDEKQLLEIRHLQFLSLKPYIIVLNISEKDLKSSKLSDYKNSIYNYLNKKNRRQIPIMTICCKLEMEISQLEQQDAMQFLQDLGIDKPASHKLIQECFNMMNLITFFTYAGDEVKAWAIKKGTPAIEAAGKIHSDIERGFIKVEVISFEDFIKDGNIHNLRAKGLIHLEGKNYIIKDGDIVHFRFNV